MADPLTSSDIQREIMGFGVSPLASQETRRSYAAAGLSPLGTQDRERSERGGGISPMAGRAEKDAWKMAEYQAGDREQAPISYGGMGERPEGSTRRAIRMQKEWDKRSQEMAEAQRAETEMALRLEAEARQKRAEEIEINKSAIAEARESSKQEQSRSILGAFIGSTRPDGTKTSPIDINDPEAPERIQRTIYMNPIGMEDQATKEIAMKLLDDSLAARERNAKEEESRVKDESTAKVGIAKELGAYGMSVADFADDKGNIDFVKANEAIGNAWSSGKQAEEEKDLDKEQRKSIVSKIDSAEEKLLGIRGREAAAQKRFEARPNSKEYRTELEAAQLERGIFEDEINRLNRMIGGETPAEPEAGDQPPRSFESVEEAEAARLPKGTIVVIGGRRARID